MSISEYEQQAKNFMSKVKAKMSFGTPTQKCMWEDISPRWVFPVTISRNKKRMKVEFGQSVMKGATCPTEYDILSTLQKYDVGSFENFCDEFGYDKDSRKSEKVYKAVCKEYESVERLFGDVMDELQEIQ